MAITCSWEKPLGTCYSKHDTERKHPITIYGGGNCLAIFCTENKNMVNFIIDEKHFKACEYDGTEFTDIVIFTTRKKESKNLIKLLLSANFEFTVRNKQVFIFIGDIL